jgi:Cu-Zn family superoxide dismutase
VTIQQTSNTRLTVSGQLSGLTPGFHGFHIHAVGICDPAVGPFTSAGPHLNPGGTGHGTHAGDLPSLLVGRNGVTRQSIQTDAVTLAQILDADGGAIIVHAAPDNFAHIPTRYVSPDGPATGGPDAATLGTGDAGARFGCGVITQ